MKTIETDIQKFYQVNGNGGVSKMMIWDALKAFLRGEILSCNYLR